MIITFSRIIYPLSIFWLQIRIKKRTNFLPIDSKMTTSQLWFYLLPVIASLLTPKDGSAHACKTSFAVIITLTTLFTGT